MNCWKCGDSLFLCSLRHLAKDFLVPVAVGAAIGGAVGIVLAMLQNWVAA